MALNLPVISIKGAFGGSIVRTIPVLIVNEAGDAVAIGNAGLGAASGGIPISVSDLQNAAYSAWPVISPSSGIYTLPAGTRNLSANVTTAGSIAMTDAGGNVKTLPLPVGFQTFPFLPATFTTTATATFWGDK